MDFFSTRRFICLVFCLFLGLFSRVSAQNAPVCFQFFFPTVQAQAGDTVCVPLMVRDFELIASIQMGIHWDSTALRLVSVDVSGSGLPDFGSFNYTNYRLDEMLVSWNAQALMGITLPDSTILFSLCFRVLNTAGPGLHPLQIGNLNLTNSQYEVVQMLPPDWRSVMMPLAQQIGGVLVGGGSPGNLAVAATCMAWANCNAPVGSASVEITGGTPPYQYAWSGPSGFSANTATISNISGGEYWVTVSDQNGSTVMAQISVAASNSGIWATRQLTNATCGQSNGCATLSVQGGQAPYTYSWSAGTSQTNSNCELPPGQHSVTISDALGCSKTTDFTIGNSSNFYLQVSVTGIQECGGTGRAKANPDGDGPFQYLWSTGDTTQEITGLLEGSYGVTVTGPGDCANTYSFGIYNYYTYNWGLSLSAYCDSNLPNTGKVILTTYYSNPTLGFPITIGWSDGTTRVIPTKPSTNKLDSLLGVPSGLYTVTVTDTTGCTSTVSVSLDCAKMPPVPAGLTAFYIKDEYLNPQYAIDSCVGVYARNFTELKSASFSLNWINSVAGEITNIRNLGLPGLSFADFTLDQQARKLGFNWQSPIPVTLPVKSLLFEVCFDPTSTNTPAAHVRFDDKPVDIQLTNGQGNEVGFIGKNGWVMFDLFFPLQPSICDFGVVPPDCAADGNSQVRLGQCNPGLGLRIVNYAIDSGYFHYLGATGSLLSLEPGKYNITATQTASLWEEFFVKIPDSGDSTACVWPGDADNNNAVNHHDLLYLGLAYGELGLARANASQNWLGQDCPDWTGATTVRNVNFKNIDTNGDGIINAADTTGIVQHWGRVVNPNLDNPFAAPLGSNSSNFHPILTLVADTLEAGQPVSLPISLGSAGMPMDSIYGLAFSISYDPALVKDNVRFQPSSSWFGDSSQFLFLQKNFPLQGHLDVAITRTDGVPVSGWGAIGDMFIIIEDNIFGEPDPIGPQDTTLKTMVYFRGLSSVNTEEQAKLMDAPPVALFIHRSTSGVKDLPEWERGIALAPNPVAETLHILSREANIERVEIIDMTGRLALAQSVGTNDLHLSVSPLTIGTYFVRVFTEHGIAVRKIVVAR